MAKCSICSSSHKNEIDDLSDDGTPRKDIAKQCDVSRSALSRHVRHTRAAAAPAAEQNGNSETLEMQAEKWMARADEIYAISTVDGDTRGQVQALTAAFRGLELQHRAEMRAADSPRAAGEGTPVTLELMDEIIRKAEVEMNATTRGRTLTELRLAPDRFLELVDQLYRDPELFHEIEQRCALRAEPLL